MFKFNKIIALFNIYLLKIYLIYIYYIYIQYIIKNYKKNENTIFILLIIDIFIHFTIFLKYLKK